MSNTSIIQKSPEQRHIDLSTRYTSYVPSWLRGFVDAGVDVTPASALQLAVFDACVNRLADDISGCPVRVTQRLPTGRRKRIGDHWVIRRLNDEPNELHTAADFIALEIAALACYANFYGEIKWFPGSRRDAYIYPLLPNGVEPEFTKAGWLQYKILFSDGQGRENQFVSPMNMVHCKWRPRPDGLKGRSICDASGPTSIGIAMAAEAFAARFFGNGTTLSGFIKTMQPYDPDANDERRKSWQEQHGGLSNSFDVAVMNEGDEFVPISTTPEQAQFLQTRQHQAVEICRSFGIKPPMIGDLTKASYSTYDAVMTDHVKSCVRPWCGRIEQEYSRKFLTEDEKRAGLRIEFDTDGLMRGDRQSQDKSFAVGVQFGWYSKNDVRDLLHLEPIEGGDEYLSPLNMGPVGGTKEPTDETVDEPVAAESDEIEESEAPVVNELRKAADQLNPILHDAVRRCLVKEVNAIKRARTKGTDLNEWANEWYENHDDLVRSAVLPAFTVFEPHTATGRAADYATKHVTDSKRDIADALVFDAIDDLYRNWTETRPYKLDLAGDA